MSYGFMVWAVDTDKLKRVAGSKDERLRRLIGRRFKRDFAELDDIFEDTIEDGEPDTAEALRQIIDGTIPRRARGGIWAYAFELVVQHLGRPLDNSTVYPWRSPDFRHVNTAFKKMGVPFKMEQLITLSLPVRLPPPEDVPLTGWLSEAKVKKLAAAFEDAETTGKDTQTRAVVETVRGWFREAAAKEFGLVCYFH